MSSGDHERLMLASLLRHPTVRPFKRVLRELQWRFKGRGISNPPLPQHVASLLFVCLGNICRSPFAQAIAAHRVQGRSPSSLTFASAGIKTKQAAEPPEDARKAAATFGVSLDGHRPQTMTQDLVDAYDMIVVMERQQLDHVRAAFPSRRDRVFLLPLFDSRASGIEREVIADPFGAPAAEYRDCYSRIDRAVAELLSALASQMDARRPGRHATDLPSSASRAEP